MGFLCGGWGWTDARLTSASAALSRRRRENLGVRYDGSHGQRLKTPRGPVPRRREEEEEGGRTWEKTHGGLRSCDRAHEGRAGGGVFTSVMAATCVGGRARGGQRRRRPSWRKKCADFAIRRLDGTRGGGAGSIECAPRASDAHTHDRTRRRRADRPPPGRVTGRIARGFPLGGTAGLDEPRTDRAARPRLGSATARRSRRGGGSESHVRCPRGNIGIVRAPLGCRADGRTPAQSVRSRPASVASKRRWPAAGNYFQMSRTQ